MTVEQEAKRLAKKAIADALITQTEGQRDITMLDNETINSMVAIMLTEDDKYLREAKRNLGLWHH